MNKSTSKPVYLLGCIILGGEVYKYWRYWRSHDITWLQPAVGNPGKSNPQKKIMHVANGNHWHRTKNLPILTHPFVGRKQLDLERSPEPRLGESSASIAKICGPWVGSLVGSLAWTWKRSQTKDVPARSQNMLFFVYNDSLWYLFDPLCVLIVLIQAVHMR